jgi:hypothetical protein
MPQQRHAHGSSMGCETLVSTNMQLPQAAGTVSFVRHLAQIATADWPLSTHYLHKKPHRLIVPKVTPRSR